jgi:hypothetical protein
LARRHRRDQVPRDVANQRRRKLTHNRSWTLWSI